ncbi:MAG: MoaD/ThiS family protein [Chloroflexi bacterium]|nr:MoaD/ThiS family protein [Chloroflexota bacterium]
MKVTISSNFDPGAGELALPDGRNTVRQLLEELSERNWRKIRFIDTRTNDIDDFFVVQVNGADCHSLPGGIDTSLKDGDRVQLDVIIFMGGMS